MLYTPSLADFSRVVAALEKVSVGQQEFATWQKKLASAQQEFATLQKELTLRFEHGGLRRVISLAQIGLHALSALGDIPGGVEQFHASDGPPVLDPVQAAALQAITNEAELVHVITPVLWALPTLAIRVCHAHYFLSTAKHTLG